MATIQVNSFSSYGEELLISKAELTGADDLEQKSGVLVVENDTASPVTLNLLGDEATEAFCPGVGTVDLSAGYDLAVAANSTVEFRLDSISEYLAGTVAVTGGTASVFAYIRS